MHNVNIDDGWQGRRDSSGILQPNENFRDMKRLVDYVHSRGLKVGIYLSLGPHACAGLLGSNRHETDDAVTWASWDVGLFNRNWERAAVNMILRL